VHKLVTADNAFIYARLNYETYTGRFYFIKKVQGWLKLGKNNRLFKWRPCIFITTFVTDVTMIAFRSI